MNNRNVSFRAAVILALVTSPCVAKEGISLDEQEYFSGPGFSFLLFHNNYQLGFQGGLQMILNDERVLDSGDLFLTPKQGQKRPELRVLKRGVDRTQQSATVWGEIEGWSSGYRLITKTDGRSIFIRLKLDRPIDWSKVEQGGFKISLYPATYFSKSYLGDAGSSIFPQQYTGRTILFGPTCRARRPLHSFSVSREDGTLMIVDPRQGGPETWFMLVAVSALARSSPRPTRIRNRGLRAGGAPGEQGGNTDTGAICQNFHEVSLKLTVNFLRSQ